MNKRFMIFVLSMTAIFFFINQYYTSKKQQDYQEHQEKQEQLAREQKVSKEHNISERTAKLSDLPVVRIYEEGHPVSWAVAPKLLIVS